MRQKKLLFAAIAALLAVAACSQESIKVSVKSNGLVARTFSSAFTKTALDEDGLSVVWSASDKINVFDETATCASYEAFTASAAGGTTYFSGYVDSEAQEFYALYPYNSDATWDYSTKTITTSLSHKQTAVKEGFQDMTNLSVAKIGSDGKFIFRNV